MGQKFKTYSFELKKEAIQERYQIMDKVASYGDVQKLARVFGVSRSGYYAYLKRKRVDRDANAKKQVLRAYQRYGGKYGTAVTMIMFADYDASATISSKCPRLYSN
ncbi:MULTISPECIES: hypothetical protein [unclassified Paenibacillus]|uniref:hypothetical protein n=1 Tax=unclassified Paenibacillus TaxID=185978 RepID=UPI000B875124|nr:hypothetical protein [Paenibacillus sp. E222]QLG39950.1 hypothetical protein HW560_18800 [Paenibacillus sp. E222]